MRVGVLGGGQLGRMLALAGYPLGLRFRFLDPAADASAGELGELVVAPYDDPAGLERFVRGLDVATFEFENVSAEATAYLADHVEVHPPRRALETAQDRLAEKECFRNLAIPTSPFVAVDDFDGLERAVQEIGLPAVLKTRRFGYDGKGQFVLREPSDLERAWEAIGGVPLILEGFVAFERELSIIAVRGRDGSTVFYPLTENHHREGILRASLAPAPGLDDELQAAAEAYAERVLRDFDYVGVLAIELFQLEDQLLANEMAPRVHNTGHWTIEGAETSQFENHLRAITGLPLGTTAPRGYSAMVNLIGTTPEPALVLAVPGAHLHLYGKAPRPGRKLGHVTLRADDPEMLRERLDELLQIVEG